MFLRLVNTALLLVAVALLIAPLFDESPVEEISYSEAVDNNCIVLNGYEVPPGYCIVAVPWRKYESLLSK
jgi:hypothetical protein